MRELTDSERKTMEQAWKIHLEDDPEMASFIPFEAGFTAGLDHRQAEGHDIVEAFVPPIVALKEENTRLRAAAVKLLAYLRGDIPLGEIEGIEEELRRVLGEGSNG